MKCLHVLWLYESTNKYSHISEHDHLTSDCPRFSIHQSDFSNENVHTSDTDGANQDVTETEDSNLFSKSSDSKAEDEKEESKSTPDKDQSSAASEETKEKTKATQKSTDPLKWFGILVPPALRTAQSTFVDAVEGPIPRLATIAREMRVQEIEIGRVKKQIKKM